MKEKLDFQTICEIFERLREYRKIFRYQAVLALSAAESFDKTTSITSNFRIY